MNGCRARDFQHFNIVNIVNMYGWRFFCRHFQNYANVYARLMFFPLVLFFLFLGFISRFILFACSFLLSAPFSFGDFISDFRNKNISNEIPVNGIGVVSKHITTNGKKRHKQNDEEEKKKLHRIQI